MQPHGPRSGPALPASPAAARTGRPLVVAARTAQAPKGGPVQAGFSSTAVAERLLCEFDGQVDRPTVTRTVQDCINDLTALPGLALPELVERSARQRLATLRDQPSRRPRPC